MPLSTIPSRDIHSNSTPIFKETNNSKDGLMQNDLHLKNIFYFAKCTYIVADFCKSLVHCGTPVVTILRAGGGGGGKTFVIENSQSWSFMAPSAETPAQFYGEIRKLLLEKRARSIICAKEIEIKMWFSPLNFMDKHKIFHYFVNRYWNRCENKIKCA